MPTQFSHVQPGDLISSTLMNQVIDELVALRQLVDALQVVTTNVAITSITGPNPLHPGDPITINGRGFVVPASLNSVTIGGLAAPDPSGTSTQLTTVVPTNLGVQSGGQFFDVVLNNARGGPAKMSIQISPKVVAPAGHTSVTYKTAPVLPAENGNPGTIHANISYIFGYEIRAFANLPGNYSVSVTTVGDPTWSAVLLGDTGTSPRDSSVFPLGADQVNGVPANIRVQVNAGVTGTATLRVDLVETTSGTAVTPANNIDVLLGIGQVPPSPQSIIRVALDSATGAASVVGTTIKFTKGTPGTISYLVFLSEAGSYTLTPTLSPSAGWNTSNLSPVPLTGPQIGGSRQSLILIATDSAGTAELLYTVVRGQLIQRYAVTLTV